MNCRLCDSNRMLSILDLGATPRCEKLLAAEELDQPEQTYPLHLRLCEDCLLLQIPALIDTEDTFTEYDCHSSHSNSWIQHAKAFVDDAIRRLQLGPESFVVEVASNDGYLLQHTVAAGIPCLGIEPSVNVSMAALKRGVPTTPVFLNEAVARQVRTEQRPADLVVANDVYARVPDLQGFTKSLRGLLADDGWLSIEVHHALNLVCLGQFDTVDHEHFQYYTLYSAMSALASAGLAVVDVELLPTRGGSLRIWAQPVEAAGLPTDRVATVLRLEEEAGLHCPDGYLQLRRRTEAARHDLLRFLLQCRAEGKRVVGFGAPGKGNTVLNYCGIRSDLLEYTVDHNPYQHGRFTPGTRIPVHDPELITKDRPGVVLALAGSPEAELVDQLSYITEWGGRLVFPLPTLHMGSMQPHHGAMR